MLVEASARAPGSHPGHAVVLPDVMTPYGYVEAPAEVRRKLCRGTVHAIRPPMAPIARVLYADALSVESPVARVPSYVRVVYALGDPSISANDVVRGDVRPGVLKPAYGAE